MTKEEKRARWQAESQRLYPSATITGEGQWATLVTRDGVVVEVRLERYKLRKGVRNMTNFDGAWYGDDEEEEL